ncbi:Phosphatidylinositol phosphatase PTPRQ-like isoform X2 [Oopsacas minuta]|uniref:Phosphatidylinositol phosphatase PTPRQ-like isoform X2 n=1 Tax=Oopsacas minuta TaxID=111878 RepID=A0AAV7JLM4_9METZ|nr:Phosphatidylinositol phosphatase PTPRQ-like isoform X2 [Oopsacas minuta]
MKIWIATIVCIFSFAAINLVKSDFSIENFTVINSTDTSLTARWTVVTNQSINLLRRYEFKFEPDDSDSDSRLRSGSGSGLNSNDSDSDSRSGSGSGLDSDDSDSDSDDSDLVKTSRTSQYKIDQSDTVSTKNAAIFEYTFRDINTFIGYNIEVTIFTENILRFTSRVSIAPACAPERILTLATSSTRLQLFWYLPKTTGIITSYTLNYFGFPLDETVRTIQINVEDGASTTGLQGPYNLTGLEEFNSYNITIIANNGLRDGISEEITVHTTQSAPSAPPLNITGEAFNSTAIYLSWLPPDELEQNGPITGYDITIIEFGTLLFIVPTVTYPAESEYNITIVGLEEYTKYSIIISAINTIGEGNASEIINTTTLEDVPNAAPENITGIPIGSTMIQLTWDPPPATEQNGVIESYYVTLYGHPFDTDVQNRTIYVMSYYPARAMVNTTIIGLEESNNYTVIISAVTAIGEGPSSQEVNVTTGIGAPDLPPQNLTARSINSTSILFTWSPPPLLNQNGLIIYYNITYRGVIFDTVLRSDILRLDNLTYYSLAGQLIIRRLSPYINYTISVSAGTIGGNSLFASIRQRTNESVPTIAPDIILLTASATELQIYWTPPSILHQNGLITHYTILYTASLFSTRTYELTFILNSSYPDTESHSQNITGLEEYVVYNFTISASTALGSGPDSANETQRTLQEVPGAPVLLTVTLETTSVTIRWNPPREIEQNGPITKYHIVYVDTLSLIENEFIHELSTPIIYPANSRIALDVTFPLQSLETIYTLHVTAENEEGIGAKSNVISGGRTLLGDSANVFTSVISSISACGVFCVICLILAHVITCLLLCMRRYREKKIIAIESTAVEMKTRTIFSNRSSLKELEEVEVPKEAIYAVIGKNQFPGASAATNKITSCVNPIGTPTQGERRDNIVVRLDFPPIDIETMPTDVPKPMRSTPDGSTPKEQKSIGESMNDSAPMDDTLKGTDLLGNTLKDGSKSMGDIVRDESRGSVVDAESIRLELIEGKERLPVLTELMGSPIDKESEHLCDNFSGQESQIT